MKILALDASTTAIGWAILDLSKEWPDDLESYGVHRLSGELWDRLWAGLVEITGKLVLTRNPMDYVAIETPVVYKNPASSIKVAYMVGLLGGYAGQWAKVLELRPDQRLTALGLPSRCRDPKPQVTRNVNAIYELDLDPGKDHDIADAIAIGWAARRRLLQEGRLET